ncbi:metabolite traffic protein EboE [Streptomyces sp. NRRL WC-3742]|uniref:metabolite traffic protein EboE n=1 Tax=Streptomyces sp. NRRL WC-3742 TaxID=1463934 RepID=UPI0004CA107B|nr:metabolite traffic protein EboE [Streptomyces sp. NRRL WC-3742]
MRLRHRNGEEIHLGYCTNVHAAEDLDGILRQLDTYAVPVRERLGESTLGIGLWLARRAAAELASDPPAPRRLRAELAARGLEVVTLNGFPYQGFHHPVVKHAVYWPDWASPQRLHYTWDLVWVLAGLLPDDVAEGSISTLPFGWASGWSGDQHDRACRHLDMLKAELADTYQRTGHTIRIAFEPEPGCLIETTGQAVHYLSHLDPEHFGLCLDICHLAVAFEDPEAAVAELDRAGISVFKAQVSCALHAASPADPATRGALAEFDEPMFLHQTRQAGRPPVGTDDLGDALAGPRALSGENPWRTHFHIPVHADPAPPLASTRPVLQRALAALLTADRPRTRHLEVETYTWAVLPEAPRGSADLVNGIAAELDWTRRELARLGLTEPPPALRGIVG